MSGNETVNMIPAFYKQATPTAFFSGMFQTPQRNFFKTQYVEMDIQRSDEDVSIVLKDLGTGYRWNATDIYVNKRFTAPVHKEAFGLTSDSLLLRQPGVSPFDSPDFRANIIEQMLSGMRLMENKIKRAMELQAAQVMQTGVATLTDKDGNALFAVDYKPKATHFVTAGTSWATATNAQKMADILAMARKVNNDSFMKPDQIILGENIIENLLADPDFLARFDLANADLGMITSRDTIGAGATYHGRLTVGEFRLDMLSYSSTYKDPATGNKVPYMDPGKVIVRASGARLDGLFGAIPHIGRELGLMPQLIPELPRRLPSPANRMDMFTNVWLSPDGEQLFGGVGARPLMVPTDIDSFGAIDTQL